MENEHISGYEGNKILIDFLTRLAEELIEILISTIYPES